MSIDRFNQLLWRASQERYELRLSKNNKYYIYDFDDEGYNRVVRKKSEMIDILENQFLEMFTNDHEEWKQIERLLKEIGGID
jgi:hypothetical protein